MLFILSCILGIPINILCFIVVNSIDKKNYRLSMKNMLMSIAVCPFWYIFVAIVVVYAMLSAPQGKTLL